MNLASVAPAERSITERLSSALERSIDDPRHLVMQHQENCRSSSALAPGNHLRPPLYDASLNTLNIPQRTRTFSDYVRCCSTSTSHDVQSSYTSPTSNVMPAPALHLSASWDERFLRLEQTSPNAATFLKFLCTLQPDEIPEILFCRMWTTRECWSCDGEIEHVDVSLNAPLINFLTRQTQFYEDIQLLESLGFIKSEPGPLGKRKFSIKPDLQDRITGTTQNLPEVEWLRLVLVCHSFPGRLEEIGAVFSALDSTDLLIIC